MDIGPTYIFKVKGKNPGDFSELIPTTLNIVPSIGEVREVQDHGSYRVLRQEGPNVYWVERVK